MARILISEPHPEVRALLDHVVTRLGHDPAHLGGPPGDGLPDGKIDVLLLEPVDPRSLAAAQVLRLRNQQLPIVCASIHPETGHTRRLRPCAYLVKPFALAELERALAAAVERISLVA
jgi:DNA-binding response OmpR family regulator